MSHLIEIDVPSFQISRTSVKTISRNGICIGCLTRLSQSATFVDLNSCRHAAVLKCLSEYQTNTRLRTICLQCHGLLKKFAAFKAHVEENLKSFTWGSKQLAESRHFMNMVHTPIERFSYNSNTSTEIKEGMHDECSKLECNEDDMMKAISTLVSIDEDDKVMFSDPLFAHSYGNDDEQPVSDSLDDLSFEQDNIVKLVEIVEMMTVPTSAETLTNNVNNTLNNCIKSNLRGNHTPFRVYVKDDKQKEQIVQKKPSNNNLTINNEQIVQKKQINLNPTKNYSKPKSVEDTSKQGQSKICKGRSTIDDDGKIRKVELTMAELQKEREEKKQEAAYRSRPFQCEYCVVAFQYEIAYKDHNKKHNKIEGYYHCNICNTYIQSSGKATDHHERHFTRYECIACLKRMSAYRSIVEHYKKTHGSLDTRYDCFHEGCDFNTDSLRKYRKHRSGHFAHQREQVKCTICDKMLSNIQGLKAHMIHKHMSYKYPCEQCDKVYPSKGALNHHISETHDPNASYYCADCQIFFKTKTSLAVHRKENSKHVRESDFKFQCDYCQKKFITRTLIENHISEKHLGVSNYKCSQCDKKFPSSRTRSKHVRTEHLNKRPERNKMCHLCGKGFATTAQLLVHTRVHTGERPLKCPHCEATFAHPAALYTHKKLKHKIQGKTTKET